MSAWLQHSIINTDRNLRLQYLAGLGLNHYNSDRIYRAMIRDTRFPESLFTGSQDTLDLLSSKIAVSLNASKE